LYDNGTSDGCLGALMTNSADISIGDWWILTNRLKYFGATSGYMDSQFILVTPPGRDLKSLEKLIFPFRMTLWIAITICLLFGYFVIFVIRFQSQIIQNFLFGTGVKNVYLNVLIGLVGGSQTVLPAGHFARYILTMFFIYTLVIRTIYQGAYFNLIKSNRRIEEVQTIDEMITKDFRFYLTFAYSEQIQGIEAVKKR